MNDGKGRFGVLFYFVTILMSWGISLSLSVWIHRLPTRCVDRYMDFGPYPKQRRQTIFSSFYKYQALPPVDPRAMGAWGNDHVIPFAPADRFGAKS